MFLVLSVVEVVKYTDLLLVQPTTGQYTLPPQPQTTPRTSRAFIQPTTGQYTMFLVLFVVEVVMYTDLLLVVGML
jgi:uncharacterized protein YqiB (DUF1249 family)